MSEVHGTVNMETIKENIKKEQEEQNMDTTNTTTNVTGESVDVIENEVITADDFIEAMTGLTPEDDEFRDNIATIIKTNYVPFKEKEAVSIIMVNKSMTTDEGFAMIDGCTAYLNYITAVLMLYTSIELASEPTVDVYDKLKAAKLIPYIFNMIDQEDLKEFDQVWGMVVNDIQYKESNPRYFVSSQVGRISDFIGKFMEAGLSQLEDVFNGMDDEQIENITSKLASKMEKTIKKVAK